MQINPRQIVEKQILKPSNHTVIQQVGIDLTAGRPLNIPHGEAATLSLNESVELPGDIYALLYGRSSYNRIGVLIRGSVYDPGYVGVVGCTIYNLSGETIVIPKNKRICQMLFFEADAFSRYEGKYQGEGLLKN